MDKSLSIIIPIYNVEKYIHPCIESIIHQQLPTDSYEIIMVNDGSTDRSMEIVSDIIDSYDNIIVIEQENQGPSVARNAGLSKACGKSVLFLDADDLLINQSLPIILEKAVETNSDMVVADYLSLSDEGLALFPKDYKQEDIVWEEKTGREMFLEFENLFKAPVWHVVFRRAFLEDFHISFEPGIYYEDVPFTHECYLKAGKCLKTNLLLNLYRDFRQNSITSSRFTMKHANSLSIAIAKTWALRNAFTLNEEEIKILQRSIFVRFYRIMTWSTTNFSFLDCFRSIRFLSRLAPDLRFTDGLPQKVITLVYRISPILLVIIWTLKQRFASLTKKNQIA